MIDPAKQTHKIRIERRTLTQRTSAFQDETWAALRTIWAAPRAASSSDRLLGGQTVGLATTVFSAQYRSLQDVTSRDRVVWEGRTLQIDGPPRDPDGRRLELEITCTEVTP